MFDLDFILTTLKPIFRKIIKKIVINSIDIDVQFNDGKEMKIERGYIIKLVEEEKVSDIIEVK